MPGSLNLVFCGTPAFAVPTLEKLVQAGFSVPLIVTQPDRPRGRGMQLALSPVKQRGLQLGLQVSQPDKIKNNDEFRGQLERIAPDAIIVVGYGRIIPQWMIDLPPLGNLNLHASLLPKYRGAAPIQWAIARGESVTGVTTMRIDAGLDTGDILLQKEIPIAPADTAVTVAPRMAAIGATLWLRPCAGCRLERFIRGRRITPEPHLRPYSRKKMAGLTFSSRPSEILNCLRGFQPWPGAYTTFRGKIFHILAAQPVERAAAAAEVIVENGYLFVGCGAGALELVDVQLEGKKRMPAADFVHGYQPRNGEKLGY